ncbi:hypothetical protein Forpe1208_v014988 [Fusarium oxysporum f. sp. rapae]|uniref:Uncharacterized protein n=1 Tax=Fusarium oxysporum f. sp. rapae TaxID=485398 RepID=A0A8J5TNC4_FUSOX|nr:hypothetical protein Forpe1208_v014988 [Fusarium oxysporum f. sp. rapae]
MGSTPATNRALYADEDGKIVVRQGFNPADTKIIDFFGLKNYVIRTEFCGEVLESETLASSVHANEPR